jgi:hypothetical protein
LERGRVWLVCEFGQGRLTKMVYFLEEETARAAAGSIESDAE